MQSRGGIRFAPLTLAALALVVATSAPVTIARAAAEGETTPRTVLVTGSSRGIGLEFVRQYAELGWRVIATCRDPAGADELAALARRHPRVVVERMDVTEPAEIAAVAGRYRGQPIDLLINNAAHLGPRGRQMLGSLDWELFGETYAVNAVGPMRVTAAFAPHVAASNGRRILTLSSAAASIASLGASPVQYYPYRASKAALNMLMRGAALDLAARGIVVGLVNPGLVDTRGLLNRRPGEPVPDEFAALMPAIESGALKLITPAESVSAMIRLVERLTPDDAGRFLNYDGQPLPW
jgi:NAD(P)-dependent dehydrogenase (short-subunit alcohol dehydrogenase family)